jgi:hypothetical protein
MQSHFLYCVSSDSNKFSNDRKSRNGFLLVRTSFVSKRFKFQLNLSFCEIGNQTQFGYGKVMFIVYPL